MSSPIRRPDGFTLTELLIGLAIASLLAALAYPAYTAQLAGIRREDGRQGLHELARRLEQHHQRWGTYAGAQAGPGGLLPALSPGGHYRLEVVEADPAGYRLAAVPQGAQAGDGCATLTYNHLGEAGASGGPAAGRCWP
jgi:type IV pilus assembly protein PilE